MLKWPWRDLDPKWQDAWLYGTGDRAHVFRYGAEQGKKGWSHAETWPGVAVDLLLKYKGSKGGAHKMALEKYLRNAVCSACGGARLNARARAVRVGGKSLVELGALPIGRVRRFFDALGGSPAADLDPADAPTVLDPLSRTIADELLKEIRGRLGFLADVGLEYLALERSAPTLSGGEAQRIRLASQGRRRPGRRLIHFG